MPWLLAAVAIMVLLFSLFKWVPTWGAQLLPSIVINYLVCVATGLVFLWLMGGLQVFAQFGLLHYGIAFLSGFLFVASFLVMAQVASKYGVGVSAVASKTSLALPVLLNLIFFADRFIVFNGFNYLGLILSVPAILLATNKPKSVGQPDGDKKSQIIITVVLFILTGAVDITINLTNRLLLSPEQAGAYTVILFGGSGVAGLLYMLITKQIKGAFVKTSFLAGLLIGIPNYFSIFSVLKGLAAFNNDGSFFFPVFNALTIVLTGIIGFLIFGEKQSKINIMGFGVAIASVVLISYQALVK